ncbi:ankyrin repeat-containing domain protein [Daldinia vernicosa]|uniref:ankyrin repeat-containing domain protein n=1 Tax=Daldinia vernicosa TaxID=114800 RepID=UPI002008C208|nr:ankyrin repeat-containing domain protein [Daldinia vernicosa]KAI0848781.1 ankyrin repeat-containing domain protein [Daldinia vernicosa]
MHTQRDAMSTLKTRDQSLSTGSMSRQHTSSNPSRDAASLTRLPNEIFLLLVREFDVRPKEIARLRQTCHKFAGLLSKPLYRLNILDVKAAQEAATANPRRTIPHNSQILETIKDFQMHVRKQRIHASQGSVLHWAASHGFVEVAKDVIKMSSKLFPEYLNVKDAQDQTPLSYAATGGHVEIIQELIDAGCLVDAGVWGRFLGLDNSPRPHQRSFKNYIATPLTMALDSRQEAAAIILARYTPYRKDIYTNSGLDVCVPLDRSAMRRMPRVVKILLSNGHEGLVRTPFDGGLPPIYCAIRMDNNTETIDILYAHDVSSFPRDATQHLTPLVCAILWRSYNNAMHIVKKYVLSGEYGSWAREALRIAANFNGGMLAVAEVLTGFLNAQGDFKGIEAAFFRSSKKLWRTPEMNKFLAQTLAVGLDKTHLGDGQGYLHWACQQPDVDIEAFQSVLENKHYPLDVNAKDANGYTPLDYSEQRGHENVTRLLREVYSAKRGDEV